MDARELRIGNLIECFKHDPSQIGKKPYWDLMEVTYGDHSKIVNKPNDYRPIPLTEEWLVRFGFEKIIPEGSIFEFGEFHVQNFSPLGFFECRNHIKIEHVHQLQNLYFALTGEELIYKPE